MLAHTRWGLPALLATLSNIPRNASMSSSALSCMRRHWATWAWPERGLTVALVCVWGPTGPGWLHTDCGLVPGTAVLAAHWHPGGASQQGPWLGWLGLYHLPAFSTTVVPFSGRIRHRHRCRLLKRKRYSFYKKKDCAGEECEGVGAGSLQAGAGLQVRVTQYRGLCWQHCSIPGGGGHCPDWYLLASQEIHPGRRTHIAADATTLYMLPLSHGVWMSVLL